MFDDDFEYCGDCCVCHDPVDEKEADSCDNCGNIFHGDNCGYWRNEQYTCRNCDEAE